MDADGADIAREREKNLSESSVFVSHQNGSRQLRSHSLFSTSDSLRAAWQVVRSHEIAGREHVGIELFKCGAQAPAPNLCALARPLSERGKSLRSLFGPL